MYLAFEIVMAVVIALLIFIEYKAYRSNFKILKDTTELIAKSKEFEDAAQKFHDDAKAYMEKGHELWSEVIKERENIVKMIEKQQANIASQMSIVK
jgi:cell division protein FtsL